MNKEEVKKLLLLTNRPGMEDLINYLDNRGFFEAPASTKFHGAYIGGLLNHSVNVYNVYIELCTKYNLDVNYETIVITTILHDACKIGLYQGNEKPFTYNSFVGNRGHGKLSVERIERFIVLTELERDMILYHMGMYTRDSSKEMLATAFKDIRVKLLYLADEIAGSLIEGDD